MHIFIYIYIYIYLCMYMNIINHVYQLHELPQNHSGNNREGTLFS